MGRIEWHGVDAVSVAAISKSSFVSAYADTGDTTRFGPTAQAAAHNFSAGTTGDLIVRDPTTSTGAAWLPSVAAGQVLASGGAGAAPAWTASPSLTGIVTTTVPGIAATSTDGLILQNTTPATAGVPVQQTPRLRLRSHVWNTTAVAADNSDDWWVESVPASGAIPSGLLKFASVLNGAAATFPLTLASGGQLLALDGSSGLPTFGFSAEPTTGFWRSGVATVTLQGSLNVTGSAFVGQNSFLVWTGRSWLASTGDGALNLTKTGAGTGVGLDFTIDALLKIRTRAQTGDATISALLFQVMTAIVAAGGGAAPTFTTIGGSGPATAAQNGWLKFTDSGGVACYCPVWK